MNLSTLILAATLLVGAALPAQAAYGNPVGAALSSSTATKPALSFQVCTRNCLDPDTNGPAHFHRTPAAQSLVDEPPRPTPACGRLGLIKPDRAQRVQPGAGPNAPGEYSRASGQLRHSIRIGLPVVLSHGRKV